MAISLTLTRTDVTTAAPGTATGLYQTTDAGIANHKNRIGEYKFTQFYFTASKSIDNFFIWINPALFMQKASALTFSGIPSTSYSLLIAAGGSYAAYMAYNGTGATPKTDQVEYVLFTKVDSTHFTILVAYYLGFDFEGFLNPATGDNHARLLKDRKSNTVELDASTGSSIYNDSNVDLRAYVYMQRASVPSDNGFKDVNPQWGYKAGFYNKGTHNAATYFTNPVFTFSRTAGIVTNLSNTEDTSVGFKCDIPALLDVRVVVFSIIRTDKFDNTVVWSQNYEFEQAQADISTPATSKMKNFVGPTFIGGSTFAASMDIDKTGVVLGGKYRIIAHAYHSDYPTNFEVDVFISDELEVNSDVPYNGNGFNFTTKLIDVANEYTGNFLECSIEERIRTKLSATYAANKWKNDIFNRLGLVVANDPRRYLTKVQVKIYSNESVASLPYEHIVDIQARTKTGPTTYSLTRGGINMSFGTDSFDFYYDFRNRYEADQPNIQSYTYPGGVAAGQLSNQYWGGRYFFIEWRLTFYYDDYVTPFTDEIYLNQVIVVNDYTSVVTVEAQNAPFDEKEFWCPADDMCLEGSLDSYGLDTADSYYLIVNIEPTPGSIHTIEEAESWPTPELAQKTTAKITDEEQTYADSELYKGKFCVDVNQLTLDTDYKITVLAKRYIP